MPFTTITVLFNYVYGWNYGIKIYTGTIFLSKSYLNLLMHLIDIDIKKVHFPEEKQE